MSYYIQLTTSLAVVPADVPNGDLLLGEAGLEVECVGPVEGRHRLLLGLGLLLAGRRWRGGRGAHGAAEGGGAREAGGGNAGDGRQGHDGNTSGDGEEMRCGLAVADKT